jgi:hypothetical protein
MARQLVLFQQPTDWSSELYPAFGAVSRETGALHAPPVDDATRGRKVPQLSVIPPTAVHSVAEVQLIPVNPVEFAAESSAGELQFAPV